MNKENRSRSLLRRLHSLMASSKTGQVLLDQMVKMIATTMLVDVCSLYFLKDDNNLELFAAFGLRQEAVHKTQLRMGRGIIGLIAKRGVPLNLAEASEHPKFEYRPETGEEIFHSMMGVPVIKQSKVAGVLAVQTVEPRHFAEEEIEVLQTIAMVLAELFNKEGGDEGKFSLSLGQKNSVTIDGRIFSSGMAQGVAVFHEPKIVITKIAAESVKVELSRFRAALKLMRQQFEDMISANEEAQGGETREILETYKMFSYDRGWKEKITKAIETGLTAEAAVEHIQQDIRVKMSKAHDRYLRERLLDLENLSARLVRVISGYYGSEAHHRLVENSIIIAKNMGPAELLDYDRNFIAGIVLEEGSATSHLTIVARALSIPLLGRAKNILLETQEHDSLIIDAVAGRVILRPQANIRDAYIESIGERAKLQKKYIEQTHLPAITLDGQSINLAMNAGLIMDMENLHSTGADGIGLFRTEFQFMISATLPRSNVQKKHYAQVLKIAGKKPVVFRTLDIGSDKIVPFLTQSKEENPAMGWRGIRMGLDRPGLLRYQLRALLESAVGKNLNIMFPMVSNVSEFVRAKKLFQMEVARLDRLKKRKPKRITLGTMIETPSLAWDIEHLLGHVDFISVGTNDLFQFFFASDRGNSDLSGRYDLLSPPVLRFMKSMIDKCEAHQVPITVCGEMASTAIEAMALMGLGLKSFSSSPSSIGPVKMMLRNLDVRALKIFMLPLIEGDLETLRKPLQEFADKNGILL